MKIKFPNAEKFIAEYKPKLSGRMIVSFETEYVIKDLVFEEGEILAILQMTAMPSSPLKLSMDIERVAELCGLTPDWAAYGFKPGKADK